MADGGGNNQWVTVAVAAIGAIGAIGAALVVRGGGDTPAPKTETVQPVADLTASSAMQTGASIPAQTTPVTQQTAATPTPVTTPAVDWRQQVLGYLDTQHKALTDAGYARDTGADDWVGLLKIGTPKVWEVQLVRGLDYQVVGVCDSDCKDVDMEIYDPSGARVGGDTLVDDYPQVQFRPANSGAHTVKVWLRQCTSADGTQSCMVAARLLRR